MKICAAPQPSLRISAHAVDIGQELGRKAGADHQLPDLSSGNHLLAALVVAQDARGERILASSASEVAILRDIEILFPSNDFVFASGQKVGPMRVYRQLAINILQAKTHKGHCADSRVAMHTRRTRN